MNSIGPFIFAGILAFAAGCASPNSKKDSASESRFYLGTYSTRLGHVDGKAKGITYWALNQETGSLTKKGGPWRIVNASHLCTSLDGKFLYAISETSEYQGQEDGYVTSFAVDKKTGNLTELGTISSRGVGPAYVSLDRTGRHLLLANYLAGNIVVYPITARGVLDQPSANIMHAGSSVNPQRQEGPHPHAIVTSPDNQFVLVPDLGLDQIKVYGFSPDSGTLEPRPTLDVTVPPGAGPRHLVFHPSGDFVYITLEMASQVAAYHYKEGTLSLIDIYRSLPETFRGSSSNAELRVTRDGRFLYASNRGHDSIAAFQINQATGALTRLQTISTEGRTPRNFNIDPSDRFLVVGNQDTHTMLTFRIDPESGMLSTTGQKTATPSPVLFHFP